MSSSEFGSLLNQYRHRLTQLQTPDPSPEAILTLLNHRDRLHHHLSQSTRPAGHLLTELFQLDEQLKTAADPITKTLAQHNISLKAWRTQLPNHSDQWWWHLDEYAKPHILDRFDGFFQGSAAVMWVVNLSLAVEIATRFFSGGAGVPGTFTIIGSSLLAFFQTRSNTPDAIKKWLQTSFRLKKVPSYLQAEVQLSLALVALVLFGSLWKFGMPIISKGYNGAGYRNYQQDDFGSAERNYKRAIAINPDNTLAHYNLGNLYEDLKQNDEAKNAYLVAVRSRAFPQAYNNLGRLYILDKDYDNAAALLHQGLENVQFNREAGRSTTHLTQAEHVLYKNLGWVEFQQDNMEAAQTYLETALTVAEAEQDNINTGAAHCLMAQIATQTEQTKSAIEHWQQCCEQAALTQPEEYQWLSQARRYLTQEGEKCKAFQK